MSLREPITGKVARVLSARELVINRGTDDGVVRGMIFEVLDAGGNDIVDPDSGEALGSVHRPKVRVRVAVTEPRLSVARTYRVRRKNVGGTGGLVVPDFDRFLRPPKWVEVAETFRTDEAAWEEISEEQSFVKVGDPVRELLRSQRDKSDETVTEVEEGLGGASDQG